MRDGQILPDNPTNYERDTLGLLMWVGQRAPLGSQGKGYPWPHNFYDEAAERGVNKRISRMTVPPPDLHYPCRMYLVHARACIRFDDGHPDTPVETWRQIHDVLAGQDWRPFLCALYDTVREAGWTPDEADLAKLVALGLTPRLDDVDQAEEGKLSLDFAFVESVYRTDAVRRLLAVFPPKLLDGILKNHGLALTPGVFMYGYISGCGVVLAAGESVDPELAAQGVKPILVIPPQEWDELQSEMAGEGDEDDGLPYLPPEYDPRDEFGEEEVAS